ncbi:hypothetical protein NT934_003992 [Salmonella enterica]|nr:hypothetical protein [Salmonella enterica]ELN2943219.1 hypothetical protein [Salmonella enterica]
MTALNKQALRYGDNVLWFLNELAAYDASDIDGGEFDVYGEDRNGLEGCSTIDVTELAADAAKLIEAAEKRLAELEARAFNPAILDVIAERQRQQSVEGWTPKHDDQYGKSQLLWASSCYLLNTIQPFNRIPMDWPWDSSWWKPTNSRRDLVKAGALILAEIERIDRAAGIGVKGD